MDAIITKQFVTVNKNFYNLANKVFCNIGRMDYAQRLQKALDEKQMNQSELARIIGVKPQSIQYLCSGKATGSKHTSAIAKALGINANWLENGQGNIHGGKTPGGINEHAAPYNESDTELLQRIKQLSPADQARLSAIIDALTSRLDGQTGS